MTLATISPYTRKVIDGILRANFAPWHYAGFEADARLDSTGDPAIYVVARFEPADELPPSAIKTQTIRELLDRLRETGDERIPYLKYRYPEDRADDEAA